MRVKIIVLSVCCIISLSSLCQVKYYVDSSRVADGDGLSWATAFKSLQTAISTSTQNNEDTILVAKGTYFPTEQIQSSDARTATFYIKNTTKIFGGFQGNETELSQRNYEANETILSGNLGDLNLTSDNAYHVILSVNDDPSTVLDGFTVRDGNSDKTNSFVSVDGRSIHLFVGGGVYLSNSNMQLANCKVTDNEANIAGGFYINEGNTSVTNSLFKDNLSRVNGGGLYVNNANTTIEKTVFENNTAQSTGSAVFSSGTSISLIVKDCFFIENQGDIGGVFRVQNTDSMSISNSVFYNNTATKESCISSSNATLNMDNCTIYNASENTTSEISNFGSKALKIKNSIIRSIASTPITGLNISVTYSNIVGGFAGSGNIDAEPAFLNASSVYGADSVPYTSDDGLALQSYSLEVNHGTSSTIVTDILGNTRPYNGEVDMGAYENQSDSRPTKFYVMESAIGANTGLDWGNAFSSLQSALLYGIAADTIWVAAGTYKPTSTTDRRISFVVKDSMKVYGGFVGTEPDNYDLSLRDFQTNEAILSGDIGVVDDSLDNTYHVVYTENVSEQTMVDGFIITHGNANTTSLNREGGGWYNECTKVNTKSNPSINNIVFKSNSATNRGGAIYNNEAGIGEACSILTNCTFTSNSANYGGAIYNYWNNNSSEASPLLTNCTFTSNSAIYGGAIFNTLYSSSGVSPLLTNCSFTSNSAFYGGAICNYIIEEGGEVSPQLTNCIFISNSAQQSGGAIYNWIEANGGEVSPILRNCTFASNSASTGGAISNFTNSNDLNSFLFNCTFTLNSATQGGAFYTKNVAGETNLNLKNCLLWENEVNAVDQAFYTNLEQTLPNNVTISNSLVGANDCNSLDFPSGSSSVTCGSGMIYNQNPIFVNAFDPDGLDNALGTADDGLQLQASSPAINQGTAIGLMHISDLIGQKHINVPDMGAYEYPCSSIQNISSVPNIANELSSHTAVQTLQANNTISPTSNVYYQAGESVLLSPGFEVKSGNVFEAVIDSGCP